MDKMEQKWKQKPRTNDMEENSGRIREVTETVFDIINQEMDKMEQKWKQKPRTNDMEENCKCTPHRVEGEVLKLGRSFLYPNRLEFYHQNRDGQVMAKGFD
ncbi:hypothetical protein NP493_1500g00004 [Ridgeia piscesae]|uniref:Uncharacterized protein n=1 Tax=Ridgeia piscesae TaxID=27915 RepID=A0AAD9NAA8_RIDPI|nr:hypothetical protein NP493_1500g00004 [Ridgeia piscesae]